MLPTNLESGKQLIDWVWGPPQMRPGSAVADGLHIYAEGLEHWVKVARQAVRSQPGSRRRGPGRWTNMGQTNLSQAALMERDWGHQSHTPWSPGPLPEWPRIWWDVAREDMVTAQHYVPRPWDASDRYRDPFAQLRDQGDGYMLRADYGRGHFEGKAWLAMCLDDPVSQAIQASIAAASTRRAKREGYPGARADVARRVRTLEKSLPAAFARWQDVSAAANKLMRDADERLAAALTPPGPTTPPTRPITFK